MGFDIERQFLKNFKNIFAGHTIVICASKLSLVRQAEQILVLHNGSIAEQGSHQELLERNNLYSALWSVFTGIQPLS